MFKGKSLTELIRSDLQLLTNEDMKRFRNHLKRKGLKESSINKKIAPITSLYRELAKNKDMDLNPHVIKLKKLKEDQDHYGYFTREEIELLIEEAKNLPNGLEKSLAIELVAKTSYRISYALGLQWNNFKKYKESHYVIDNKVGNKKEDNKTITKEFYDRLLQIKIDDEKLFHMNRVTLNRTIDELVEKFNLDPDDNRNLKPHSLKNYGINEVYDKTKDIRLMAKQGNHSAQTSLKHYARRNNDPLDNPSLLVLEKIDDSKIKNSTLEELLKAIDQCSDNVKLEILSKLR